ncbi:hypothetical protein K438DRAFT_1835903 [Mycena galopus ATCC 62051]|nr:hypothetical protein K438DRAFT_1835903 [Mycena galopus ATCC 62051]
MYVYVGKLNWFECAQNECITVVFPAGFALMDPVCAYWQWTVDATGNAKSNCTQEAFITSVTNTADQYHLRFPFSYYAFEGSVSADFSSLFLRMSNPQGEWQDVSLSLLRGDAARRARASAFTGKLHWFQHSLNEMVTLVIPGEVANGEPVILSHQWTKDGAGNLKANHTVSGTLRTVNVRSNGDLSATFDDGYYTFDFTLRRGYNDVVLSMSNPSGEHDSRAPYNLKQTDFRTFHKKKALILRFGTSTDDGIFMVVAMLFKHLGFASDDIELLYFDVDPPTGPKQCTKGQDPPTATNFKSKFMQLCRNAVAGDVGFLYVDAHGTTYPDANGSGEPDLNQEEGWILAANSDGTRKEVVSDDWLGTCIRNNLAKGVNLTILTSSCMGGSMLDMHSATPRILLPGCHETQFNVELLKGMDPWMVAMMTVIKNNIYHKCSMPKYWVLFNDAKKFIRTQLTNDQLNKYPDSSPIEWQLIPRDQNLNTSNQDPQLVFKNRSSKSVGDGMPSQTVNHYIFGGQGGGGGQGGVHGGGGGLGEGPTLHYDIKAGHLTINMVHTSSGVGQGSQLINHCHPSDHCL